MEASDPRTRVVLEDVQPTVDGGAFPAKGVEGDPLTVRAVAFADGHDHVAAEVHWVSPDGSVARWPMRSPERDRFEASVLPFGLGEHRFTIQAWIDRYETWKDGILKKVDAQVDVAVELMEGVELVEEAAERAQGPARAVLDAAAATLRASDAADRLSTVLHPELSRCMQEFGLRLAPAARGEFRVWVEPLRARFSAWYEFFPRSASPDLGRSGTLRDATRRLRYVADLGFDTVYFPPIHPIGRTLRKGPNNALDASPQDPGSPWAIGAEEGGHFAIAPELGSFADLEELLAEAQALGLHVALDVAFQCAPDHPWVKAHPRWFRQRPNGTIRTAENPPKKYEDILPLDFETDDAPNLWRALHDVFAFWIERGVKTFRVDNPHTKSFSFWEWVIPELKRAHPDLVFLSEAFARPTVAHRLAKLGFTQSYGYFPWKNSRWELEAYFEQVAKPSVLNYMRTSSWTNTPDILTEYLQVGGRPASVIRAVLASTLSASYGVYGPPFELVEVEPRHPGSEEYLDSEKYQVRHWTLEAPHSLGPLLARLNRIRRAHPALWSDATLEFLPSSNPHVVAYRKRLKDQQLVVVASVDPHHPQESTVQIPDMDPDRMQQLHDLLSEERYVQNGPEHRVRLQPHELPARIYLIRRRHRSERDFEYFQ